jgi:WD40 repeat protein
VGHSGTVNKVAWSPDDKQIASVGSDGALLLWNIFF